MRILKIPYNAGGLSKKNGVEQAPGRILDLLKEVFLREDGLLPVFDILDVKVENDNIEQSQKSIMQAVSDYPFIALGGDHSITKPLFTGFSEGNSGMIVFDAHPDLCEGKDSHEDYLRNLIEDGILKPQNLILVGIRNIFSQEQEFIKKHRLNTFNMREISMRGIKEVSEAVMSVARHWDKLYVSIDIDVLDPAFAPGTGHAEPGGMTSRELIYFIQRLKILKNFRAADIVEVNPLLDMADMTSKMAAKLAIELC